MPQIPRSLDRAVPQGRRPINRINTTIGADAAIDAAGIEERGMQQIASGMASQANSLQRAQDAMDENAYYDARGKFLQAKVEQDSAFDHDPEWGTYEKRYGENLGKVRSDLIAGLQNGRLRRRFEEDTAVDLAQGLAGIKSRAFDRETKDGIDSLNSATSEGVSAALKARDEKTRATIIAGINGRIDAAAKAQYITGPGAKELKRKVAEQYAQQSLLLLPPSERMAALVPGAAPPKPGITQTPLPSPEIAAAVKSAPKDDQATLARIAELESKGDPSAVNPVNPDVVGLFQFSSKTADEYGLKDRTDPKASTEAAAKLLADNRTALRGALNREPTPAELYLAHQQGATGAAALLGNPDQPAIVALTAVYGDMGKARKAILQNGGTEGMTAGQFTSLWANKFNGGSGEPIGQVLSGEVPAGGWDFSQPNGTAADYLDPVVRAKMIDDTAKEMKDQSKTAREAAQVAISVGSADENQNAFLNGKADPAYEAKLMAAYPDERGIKMVEEYRQNAQAGADNNLIKNQSITDDPAMLAGAEKAAMEAGPGSAEAAKRYGQLATAIKQKHEALKKDPAQYVIDNDPGAQDAGLALTSIDPTTPEGKVQARIAYETITQAQKRLGVTDPKPLTETQSLAIGTAIAEAKTPKDQLSKFLAYADTGDPELTRQIIGQVSSNKGLPAGSDLVASVAIEGGDRRLAETLWSELTADTKGIDLGASGRKAVTESVMADDSIGAVIKAQAEQTGDSAGLSQQLQPFMQAVEQITKARVAFGEDPAAAAKQVVSDLSSSLQIISDPSVAQVYIPKDTDRTLFEDGLYAERDKAALAFPDDPYSQALARDIRETAVWVNDGDGVSLIVPGTGRALVTKSFEDIVKAGKSFNSNIAPLTGYEGAVDQIKRAPTP